MTNFWYNYTSSNRKNSRSDIAKCPAARHQKGEFLMQPHSTRIPFFPPNLDDHAPWVAKHGLTAPYGECQCGCGQPAPVAYQTDREFGVAKGLPRRYISGHNKGFYWTLEDAFWKYCTVGESDDCWEWQGSRDGRGYGQFSCFGAHHKAHRTSYELHYSPILDGLCVLHTCDNPPCCNPRHLFLGTIGDNSRDMVQKGRGKNAFQGGAAHPRTNARLKETDIPVIRELRMSGMYYYQIAPLYGVSTDTIRNVVNGTSWSHVK